MAYKQNWLLEPPVFHMETRLVANYFEALPLLTIPTSHQIWYNGELQLDVLEGLIALKWVTLDVQQRKIRSVIIP